MVIQFPLVIYRVKILKNLSSIEFDYSILLVSHEQGGENLIINITLLHFLRYLL